VIVTHILGDCPKCQCKDSFGNVLVSGNRLLRGCKLCEYATKIELPRLCKKIIYLDQFFFSSAFRATDERFITATRRIGRMVELQLLSIPYSTIHEDETHQWRGYGGKTKESLMKFIKATSRGYRFIPSYEVEQTQIIKAFKAFLAGQSPTYTLEESDAIRSNVHEWDGYVRIDVNRYVGQSELIRKLKKYSVEELIDLFEDWAKSENRFDQNVAIEMRGAANTYLNSYFEFAARVAAGDIWAFTNAPVNSLVVESMLRCLPRDLSFEECMAQVVSFFNSKHFTEIPFQSISARIYSVLRDKVKHGAYKNREKALDRLMGLFHDVGHVATYAPYCHAFVMDQAMEVLVADARVDVENRYGVRVFTTKNLDKLLGWLEELEQGMTEEHKMGLSAAYPWVELS